MALSCVNCQHSTGLHLEDGCGIAPCDCPFGYTASGKQMCPKTFIKDSGDSVECIREAGHTGRHEGFFDPGNKHVSWWKNEGVTQPSRCTSEFRPDPVAKGVLVCELDAEHTGPHRAGHLYWPPGRTARDTQVGGSHYSRHKIQPWDVVDEYGLDFYAGSALTYLLRAGRKGSRVEDLKKARHYLDKLIELEEGGE